MTGGTAPAVRVGVLGGGVVGSQVVRLLTEQADELAARVGAKLELVAVAVRRPARHPEIPAELLTTDAAGAGRPRRHRRRRRGDRRHRTGQGPAADRAAPGRRCGHRQQGAARRARPGAVRGGRRHRRRPVLRGGRRRSHPADPADARIPCRRPDLAHHGDRQRHHRTSSCRRWSIPGWGITRRWPRPPGSATPRPTRPPTSTASTPPRRPRSWPRSAFHTRVGAADVHREGIAAVSAAEIAAAREIGCTVKLLAICERVTSVAGSTAPGVDGRAGGEGVSARVHPVMLPTSHPLASVDGAFNAVYVEAEAAGRLMFYGPGAGGAPTASAVLGDLVAVARNRLAGGRGPRESAYAALPIQPMGEVLSRYHICLDVDDRPACWPRWPPASPRPGCRSPPSGRRARGRPGSRRRDAGRRHAQRAGGRAGRHRSTSWPSWIGPPGHLGDAVMGDLR